MNAKVIKVGNSSGIILPSSFLKILGVETGCLVNLEIRERTKEIVVKPQLRVGWADAFRRYAQEGEDEHMIPEFFEDEEI